MSDAFDVTVCIPTYQGEAYLDACLESVAEQDLEGVEVLVVDDASTDATLDIVESHADRLAHLRVEHNAERRGAVANVNRCIELAKGRWIKPLFQDDLLEPGCLTSMRSARHKGVPVVVCDRSYRYEEGVPEARRSACEHLLDESLARRFGPGLLDARRVAEVAAAHAGQRTAQLNFVGEPMAMLLERRAVLAQGGFDTGYVQLWDYELVLRLAMHRGLVIVDEPLATFRVHQESETARNLSGSTFRADAVDRLRLHTAYAIDRRYRTVRKAAARIDPPVDLPALAVGVGDAVVELLDDLTPTERAAVEPAVHDLRSRLPDQLVGQSRWTASETTDALLWELAPERGAERARMHAASIAAATAKANVDQPAGDPSGPDPSAAEPPVAEPTGPAPSASPVARVARGLRTNQWWGHMLGPIVAMAYLQLGWRQVAPGAGILRVLALLASAIALAGYGYVVNDTCDIEPDRRAGKPNAMAKLPAVARPAVIVGFAILGLLPWLWLHLDVAARIALAGIYLVPILYSAPPIRLKERHLLGPVADASNAFVLPALFTVALFAPLGEATGPPPLMVVGAVLWAAGFGLRAIVKHQIDDIHNDRASGTKTLVLHIGEARARTIMHRVLFPTELLGLVLLTATVLTWSWGTVLVGVGWAAIFNALRLTGVVDRSLATTTLDKGWWMYWYQLWPALLVSLGLAASDPWYLLLVGLVALLFWPRLRSSAEVAARVHLGELRRIRVAGRS